jgi:pilus assembly protein Flp/PilA
LAYNVLSTGEIGFGASGARQPEYVPLVSGKTAVSKRRSTASMQNLERMLYIWTRFLADESGQDIVEYALLAALLALGLVTAMNGIASDINNAINSISSRLNSYTSG